MKFTLVKPDGSLSESRNFDSAPPILSPNKGRWLPDNPPDFNPATHIRTVQDIPADAVEIPYLVAPRNPADIAAEQSAKARETAITRIAEIRTAMADHLADLAVGTPQEQGQARAALGLLRAELALAKGKL